ncbi:carbamoyl-phosphate synthase L chain, ATP binding domain-containing protein [Ditylenchus destructor]|nr:carbamoyl-phosphate synthase L chain, ATP binding domain-containing protein [Ditylenchus destructor]
MPPLQNHVKYSLKLSRHIFLKRYNFYSTSTVGKIDRVLIANRGEIACRVIRTAKRLGIESVVAVYSDPDSNAQHVRMCNGPGDLAFRIGEAPSLKSYLRAEKIIEVAKQANVQAIHPGYGFLSENAAFAEACADAGIKFMGPSADAIRAMGQKNRAKQIMIDANVPVLLGYNGADQDPELLLEEAKKIGFPVMIKPVYGGGGKGMRVSNSVDDFMECLESAKSESTKSFGNAEMILERYIADPRHVEVQIFGDMHGNYVHLWERDCSIQRRHQKIIEEAPAPGLDDETRQRLGNTAVNAARAVQYEGAGTVEFIYDRETADFYFMEMNTRLEPVTEAVTGVDLVEWQFKVAEGKPLPIVNQSDIKMNGHALEARIYAEEIDKTTFHFMPSAGVLEYLRFPETRSMNDGSDSMAPYTRVDSGVQEGDCVSVHYDPMIAKIVGWAPSRTEAIKQLDKALSETHIGGLQNNIKFVKACLAQPQFVSGDVATDFIEKNKEHLVTSDHFAPKPTNCAIDVVFKNAESGDVTRKSDIPGDVASSARDDSLDEWKRSTHQTPGIVEKIARKTSVTLNLIFLIVFSVAMYQQYQIVIGEAELAPTVKAPKKFYDD